jgi:F420-dependent oxidoreductase-like protein
MDFGLQVYQDDEMGGGNMWDGIAAIARAADQTGWASLWMWDHFMLPPPYSPPGHSPMLECFVALGALAAITERAKLGQLVLGVPYRNPALVAKMATTLDVISHGRSILGLGAGWAKGEYEAYGWPEWDDVPVRMRRLEEATRVILAMWGEGPATFEGRYYRVAEALNHPPPIQRPHPPIMIGGSGEQVTLKLVAKYAQWCNVNGDPARVAGRLETLRAHCQAVNRPIEEITLSNYLWVLIGRDEAEVARKLEAMGSFKRPYHGVAGTPAQLIEALGEYAKLGVQHCVVQMTGERDPDMVRLFGETVIPALKSA